MDFSKMKVADLKKELKNRGLSTVGNKNELQERLQLASLDNDPNMSEFLDDDVLNDDELEEDAILDDPQNEDESLLSISDKSVKIDPTPVPEKKIVLKRKFSASVSEEQPEPITPVPAEDANGDEIVKKVIKLKELTAQERLDLRMKKFGATSVSSDIKKQVRAERFGTAGSDSNSENKKLDTSGGTTNIDILKKRAERFGTVSSKLTTIENQEKLQKRQERFGASGGAKNGSSDITTTTTTKGGDYAEKAKQRLERFKTEIK